MHREVTAGMTGLDEKSLAELEAMSADFREQIERDPQHSRVEQVQLEDVEWEIEKRRWRRDA
jgi:hypothetical protein